MGGVAEVFVGNRAERDADAGAPGASAARRVRGGVRPRPAGRWDGFVNGLNRLPRPMLALGTLGLFAYAMAAPAGFSVRMQGLQLVPEPLWWLLGAIVSFYFGARELHHQRTRPVLPAVAAGLIPARNAAVARAPVAEPLPPARNSNVHGHPGRGSGGRPRLQRGCGGMAPPARLRP